MTLFCAKAGGGVRRFTLARFARLKKPGLFVPDCNDFPASAVMESCSKANGLLILVQPQKKTWTKHKKTRIPDVFAVLCRKKGRKKHKTSRQPKELISRVPTPRLGFVVFTTTRPTGKCSPFKTAGRKSNKFRKQVIHSLTEKCDEYATPRNGFTLTVTRAPEKVRRAGGCSVEPPAQNRPGGLILHLRVAGLLLHVERGVRRLP